MVILERIFLHNSQGDGMEQDRTQFAVLILGDDTTGCDKIGDYCTTEADTIIGIVCEVDLNKVWFKIFIFNKNI